MDKRVQASATLAKESLAIQDTLSNAKNSNVLKNSENNKLDSRREQLLRWKVQKEAAEGMKQNKNISNVNFFKAHTSCFIDYIQSEFCILGILITHNNWFIFFLLFFLSASS